MWRLRLRVAGDSLSVGDRMDIHARPTDHQVLEHQTIAIVVVSGTLAIKLVNPAAEDLFGVSGHRVLGASLNTLFQNPEKILGDSVDLSSADQTFTLRQQPLHLPDGEELIVDLTVVPIDGGDLLIEAQPLNRLMRINLDDRLINVQETTAELVRGLAHEIKNPLGGIRGAAQLLDRELDREDLAEYTGVIVREADRLTELVDNMLGPSRPLKIVPVNVHKLLEHVARIAKTGMVQADLDVARDYDPSLPAVDADEDQLIQALLNLVSNACIALEDIADGRLTLRTRALRQFTIAGQRHRLVVQIDVIDNGPGIPEQLIDRMFYPMISGRPHGTGLGLAIAQTIVRRHNGVLECVSRPGRTRFSVILPLQYLEVD